MKKTIEGQEDNYFRLTNHQVEQLKMVEGFNKNHLAKVLVGHIDLYKDIIHNLINKNNS